MENYNNPFLDFHSNEYNNRFTAKRTKKIEFLFMRMFFSMDFCFYLKSFLRNLFDSVLMKTLREEERNEIGSVR
jgi:hypothetical protein